MDSCSEENNRSCFCYSACHVIRDQSRVVFVKRTTEPIVREPEAEADDIECKDDRVEKGVIE